jgi:VWFA-related protein
MTGLKRAGGVLLAALAAQGGAPQEQRQPIRVATRLVQVHVIVQDRDRNPVADLTRADFRLLEDGKEQPIELFDVESAASAKIVDAAAQPHTFSNQIAGPGTGVTVILIDRLNTSLVDQLAVRNQALTFLRQIRPGDRVGLYLLDNSDAIRVLHDFTTDVNSLIRATSAIKARTSNELATAEDVIDTSVVDAAAGINAEFLAWAKAVDRQRESDLVRDRAKHTNAGLETIARRLAGVRGRKNLLWISSAFPIMVATGAGINSSLASELNTGLRALNDANVAVYPIDARRLIGAFSGRAADRNQTFTTLSAVQDSVETLQLVADDTGGRAYFNTNDLSGAMRRAMDDARVTYILGYYPSHNNWNGTFRQIKVEVKRRGVDVRHRKGYASTPALVRSGGGRDVDLRETLQNPLEATAMALDVKLAKGDEPATLAVTMRVDPRNITLTKAGERWNGEVDLLIAQRYPQGGVDVNFYTTLTLNLTAEQRDRVLREGLVVTRPIAIQPSTHQLRVAARDAPTGATGSLIIPAEKLRAVQ